MRTSIPLLLTLLLTTGCGLQLRPLPSALAEEESGKPERDPRLVYRFFDEDYIAGGYGYWYPDESKVFIPEESGKNGEVALRFDLVADDYSGGSVCLYNLLYDLSPYLKTGALTFWIKGARGGEIAQVTLVDDENTDGKKTVVRLPINDYGGIAKEWAHITVPLAHFGKRGVYWDEKKGVEIPETFDWDKVSEFRIEVRKGENESFRVWVDDIFMLRDVVDPSEAPEIDEEYWDEREKKTAPAPIARTPEVEAVHTIFEDDLPVGGFAYVYGGKTAYKVLPTGTPDNPRVLATYQDNSDYSGVTVALGEGRSIDISDLRGSAAGLAFWARGGPNVSKAYVGILDDESDGKKVQTKVMLSDFGRIDTTWQHFMIPLRGFPANGLYWDESRQAEIGQEIDWTRINEFRFSVNRYENRVEEGEPACIYLDRITIIDSIPGYVDPEEYWAEFESDKPDMPVHDFESETDRQWESSFGPKSNVEFSFVEPEGPEALGDKALEITYKLGDWCDVYYDYPANNASEEKRDWSQHWGLRFWFYTDKAYQPVTVQVSDAGKEIFVANAGGRRGWSEVLVPFKDFGKFPYYQPEDAEQNGRFDLEGIHQLDFKPAGEGTGATYRIDNVVVTNQREVAAPEAPEKIAVTLSGDLDSTLTEKINDGIFGINVALWDGDMLKPKTEKYVKAVGHSVLRYPGGLRADEDHWQEVLKRKDWMVDTDEFMEFCAKTGNDAMITVNFGRGTAEEAAAWVKHCNVDNDYDVKLWEVGNELYGDWHTSHCSAEEYGKRTAEFIKAMKAVEPDIKIGVVWVLEGEWNKTVFEYTRDLADAVIVHHYPQHAGEENDFALLAAPQSLEEILPAVRRQVEEYGAPDKDYEVWLTEWNSVDFNPGPQTLSVVNGLFLADYLGVLSRHNIEHADYWDVHNSMTPEGGDYGYLSRTGAPDGDNVPRPSYWAFRLAAEALRGRLAMAETDNENVTAYLCEQPDGTGSLLIVNKQPQTKAEVKLDIPGLTGKAVIKMFTPDNAAEGFDKSTRTLTEGEVIVVPAYSAAGVLVKME